MQFSIDQNKLAPTVLALTAAFGKALWPCFQAFVAAHPSAMYYGLCGLAVLAHFLPSPIGGKKP